MTFINNRKFPREATDMSQVMPQDFWENYFCHVGLSLWVVYGKVSKDIGKMTWLDDICTSRAKKCFSPNIFQYLKDLRDRGAKVIFHSSIHNWTELNQVNSAEHSFLSLNLQYVNYRCGLNLLKHQGKKTIEKVIIGDFYEEAARYIMCQVKILEHWVCMTWSTTYKM